MKKGLFGFMFIVFSINVFSQLYINEFLTSNSAANYTPDNTMFVDWIELYNSGGNDINIGGYFLTDDSLEIQKWHIPGNTVIPANGYKIFWADGLNTGNHTNFKLSKGGEYIGLFSPSLELMDELTYHQQTTDISYGRNSSNLSEWGYYFDVTPEAVNNTEFYIETIFTEPPVYSLTGGIYSGVQEVNISCISTTATIHYTIDGTNPTEDSPIFISPISIDETTVIRARCFDDGLMPSQIISNSYFIDLNHDLPVISIITEPKNMFNDTIGIYCVGTNGIIGFGDITANYWHRDWERPANVEFFEEDGIQVINQNAGIAINGQRRNMAQKSLRLFARNKYGNPRFNHKFFKDIDINQFQSLVLRNGGIPDLINSLIRDNLGHKLIEEKTDVDIQGSRMSVVYLNGEYYGIYSIKEKQNEKYLAAHHKVSPSNVDLLENSNAAVIEGSNVEYNYLKNILLDGQIENEYNFVNERIDISEYIDYLSTEIYLGNYDWPLINIKFWKERSENSKWRWLLFDVDPCFGLWGDEVYNSVHHALAEDGPGWPNPPASTELNRLMMSNERIRNTFTQSFCAHASSTFSAERIKEFAEQMKNEISSEIPRHIARWKDYDSPDGTCVQTYEEWEATIEDIKYFADHRRDPILQYLIEEFDFEGLFELTTNVENGKIKVYSVELNTGESKGDFVKNIPIRYSAVPDLGYQFVRWEGASNSTNSEIELSLSEDTELTAIFEIDERTVLPVSISGIDTLYYSLSPYIGLGDLTIMTDAHLYIEPGVKVFMPAEASIYVYGSMEVDGNEDLPVVFDVNHEIGDVNWGALCFENATATSEINYLQIKNTTTGANTLTQKAAISSQNSTIYCNYVDITNCYQPFYSEYGNVYISESRFECNYACDIINIKYADNALVENCIINGNDAPDTDGVDYDDIANGIIRGNTISGFHGFNSDGIDIGEGSVEVLIEDNRIFNCTDKGISIGQASSAIIKNNILYNCNMGVGVKDNLSIAYIEKCTFYNNDYAVASFQKNYNAGGGQAVITNSILSKNQISPLMVDSYSTLSCSYSCSDSEALAGENNIQALPIFVDTLLLNFELANNSPCIDAGDPDYPLDEDGTITDMGAIFQFSSNPDTCIIINEINYNSDSLVNSGDWIELFNKTSTDIDLSGWSYMDGDDNNIYIFPKGLKLIAKHYLVLTSQKELFVDIYPSVTNFRGDVGFNLKNSGELIRLYDNEMQLVDRVEYSDQSPWDNDADGKGPTLELINPFFDNSLAESWKAIKNEYGSPGESNGWVDIIEKSENNQFTVYPNPASNKIYIENQEQLSIEIVNLQGVVVLKKRTYDTTQIDISNLSTGFYLLKIWSDKKLTVLKLVVKN